MSKNTFINKPVAAAVGTAFVTSMVGSTAAVADDNPFEAVELDQGYMLASHHGDKEGKCGEGKCGGEKKAEGACGEEKATEGKCGEGKCGGEKKAEGACGGEKKAEGKCGEGKCGGEKKAEGSCGGSH
jgi:uncharacterized low-complexity protein